MEKRRDEQLGKFNFSQNVITDDQKVEFLKQWEDAKDEMNTQKNFELQMIQKEQKEQEALWEGKEIMPFGFNIMIKPREDNPYLRKISTSGLFYSDGSFRNPDTGEQDILQNGIMYAVVEQVGPDVKHVRKGDEIMYAGRIVPLPFKEIGFVLINEGQVLGIINKSDNLTSRFVNYGKIE